MLRANGPPGSLNNRRRCAVRRFFVLVLAPILGLAAQEGLGAVTISNDRIAVEVGDFGDSTYFEVKATPTPTDWLWRFSSFVSVNGGAVQAVNASHFETIMPVHLHGPRVTDSTVRRRTNDIGIRYQSAVDPNRVPDPSLLIGGARWDVYAWVTNLTEDPLQLTYYWYLDLEYAGHSSNNYARMTKVARGLQMGQWEEWRDNKPDLPAWFIDEMSPSRWEIDAYPDLFDKLNTAAARVDLAYARDEFLDLVFGLPDGFDVTAAFQHDRTLGPGETWGLIMSPMSGRALPEPTGFVVWGLGSGLVALVVWIARRRGKGMLQAAASQ